MLPVENLDGEDVELDFFPIPWKQTSFAGKLFATQSRSR
jgi:hypothetical protein